MEDFRHEVGEVVEQHQTDQPRPSIQSSEDLSIFRKGPRPNDIVGHPTGVHDGDSYLCRATVPEILAIQNIPADVAQEWRGRLRRGNIPYRWLNYADLGYPMLDDESPTLFDESCDTEEIAREIARLLRVEIVGCTVVE